MKLGVTAVTSRLGICGFVRWQAGLMDKKIDEKFTTVVKKIDKKFSVGGQEAHWIYMSAS